MVTIHNVNQNSSTTDAIAGKSSDELRAWTTTAVPVVPNASEDAGCICRIEELPFPPAQFEKYLRKSQKDSFSLVDYLEKLTPFQRLMMLDHAKQHRAELVYIKKLGHETLQTVFGYIPITNFLLITKHSITTTGIVQIETIAPEINHGDFGSFRVAVKTRRRSCKEFEIKSAC
jgi:hypothetical protein